METRFANFARSFVSWVCATALVCVCLVGFIVFQRADEELRLHIEQKLGDLCPHHQVRIGSAHFAQGTGFRLRSVSIFQRGESEEGERQELVFCDEAFLFCDPTLDQFVRGEVDLQRVLLRQVSIRVKRRQDATWNIDDLIPRDPTEKPAVAIDLEDIQVKMNDELGQFDPIELRITEGSIGSDRTGNRCRIVLDAKWTSPLFQTADVRVRIDPDNLAWDLAGSVKGMQCDSRIWKYLPRSPARDPGLPEGLSLDGLRLVADFGISMAQGVGERIPRFRIAGNRLQGRFDAPRALPHPITEISAESFHIQRNGDSEWDVSNLKAQFGLSQMRFSARGDLFPPNGRYRLVGGIENLELTRAVMALLPRKPQRVWEKYRPLGLLDIKHIDLLRQGGRWRVMDSDVECRDVSLLCSYFRYPVSRAQGRVQFRQDERLRVDLWASADNGPRTPVHILADIKRPGPHFRGTVTTRSHGWLPIDEPLRTALGPKVRRILMDLKARGELAFTAELRRDATTNQVLKKDIAIGFRGGSLQYKAFPYPLQHVSGNVHVQDHVWKFHDFVGENDSCTVSADGDWIPPALPGRPAANDAHTESPNQGQLGLRFLARNIPCDAELRNALPAGPQQIWRSLRPTGHIDHVQIDLLHRPGMPKPEIDILVKQDQPSSDILPRGLEIQPTWFPIRMKRVTGTVDYQHGGQFTLSHLHADYGSPRNAVQLRSVGRGEFRNDGTWTVHLDRILADGLDVTPELIAALPRDLGQAMKSLHFQGKVFADGEMQFVGSNQPNSTVESSWSATVNIDSGSWTVAGHDVRNAFGDLRIHGYRKRDESRSYGTADFPTLICRGVQVTQLRTPWHMDQRRLTFGAHASSGADDRVPSLTARLFGGELHADGFVSLVNNNAFRCYAELVGFDAAKASRDLRVTSRITGDGDARLHLTGSGEGLHTLGGSGSVRLRNAELGKLPGIIRLVNEMKVKNVRADVFSSSDVVFEVGGPYLNFRRFDLHGESLSLKGKGWIAFDRRINIAFYPIAGGEKGWTPLARPLVELVGWGGEKLLQTVVSGTVDNLSMSQEVLPGLNELLPEQARQPQLLRPR